MIIHSIHQRISFKNSLATILILLLIALTSWISNKYIYQVDISNSSTNSLTLESQKVIKYLPESIDITAFIEKGQSLRIQIIKLINLYKIHKKNISLNFIDPEEYSDQVDADNKSTKIVFFVNYQNHTKKLNYLDEHSLTQALIEFTNANDKIKEVTINESEDRVLNFSEKQIFALNLFYLLLLPSVFIILGLIIRQHRKSK